MKKDYVFILDMLDKSTSLVAATWTEVKRMCANELDARQVLNELIELEQDSGFYQEQQPFYTIFKSYLYLYLSEIELCQNVDNATKAIESALKEAKRALDEFRVFGNGGYYNEALIRWFLGLVFLEHGEIYQKHLGDIFQRYSDGQSACDKLEEAVEQFDLQIKMCQTTSDEKRKRDCIKFIKRIQYTKVGYESEREIGCKEKSAVSEVIENSEFLAVPWLPILSSVQAGKNGPIWVNQPKTDQAELPFITLNNNLYTIHLIKSGGKRLTLQRAKEYAWAPVLGDSMNNASPEKINEHDYVLFESTLGPSARTLEENDIVIVSLPDAGGYTYAVKRYEKTNNIAVSDTTEKGSQYSPISLDKERQILGVVLAVAKPIEQKSFAPTEAEHPAKKKPSSQRKSTSSHEQELLARINTLSKKDKEQFIRLVDEKRRKFPDATRVEIYERVIEDWEHDLGYFDL